MANFFRKPLGNMRREFEGVASFGVSEMQGNRTRGSVETALGLRAPGLPPETPGRIQSSPYAQGAPQFDATGRPIGPMPGAAYGLDWQYEADRRTEQRKQALWGDAQNVMRQGADLMQTYRPGGSAALASGIFQNRGSMYGTQAMNTESPDLLMGYRERKQQEADAERKKAERLGATMGLVQAGAAVLGAATGGFGGALAGGMAGMAAGQAVGGTNPMQQPAYQVGQSGPGGSVQVGGTGGGMPGGQPGQVGGSGPGGSKRVPGQGGGPGGVGNEKGGAEGLQSGSGMPQSQMDNPMSMFSSQEAAYNAMLANTGNNDSIYEDWAASPVRSESTMARIRSARLRLQASYFPA